MTIFDIAMNLSSRHDSQQHRVWKQKNYPPPPSRDEAFVHESGRFTASCLITVHQLTRLRRMGYRHEEDRTRLVFGSAFPQGTRYGWDFPLSVHGEKVLSDIETARPSKTRRIRQDGGELGRRWDVVVFPVCEGDDVTVSCWRTFEPGGRFPEDDDGHFVVWPEAATDENNPILRLCPPPPPSIGVINRLCPLLESYWSDWASSRRTKKKYISLKNSCSVRLSCPFPWNLCPSLLHPAARCFAFLILLHFPLPPLCVVCLCVFPFYSFWCYYLPSGGSCFARPLWIF